MSQEYTPVDWVDETPNTPGTLINKARLDQMQTAHHYADGFEEVDAVPTADPGVDYHKVVFCTADTTFYRWDGTQWVKDVDDDTKALLLAHEADHANPHVVTKAQVGLGNADNTADLDKPISTATQTALDAKLDDSQLKTSWSSPVSDANIPSEKLTKDTLDAKLDDSQLKTAWSSPVKDTNIPSEKLTKDSLDLKADKTQLSDGSVTKIGTTIIGNIQQPIFLLDGVPTVCNTMVDTIGNQTVAGAKTFMSTITQKGNGINQGFKYVRTELPASRANFGTTTIDTSPLGVSNDTGDYFAHVEFKETASTSREFDLKIFSPTANGWRGLSIMDDGSVYATCPSRTYNASNISDIVNISLLDGYTPMVRTSGNQSIAGIKTFTSAPYTQIDSADGVNIHLRNNNITLADQTGGHNTSIAIRGASDALLARLRYRNGVVDSLPTRNFQVDLYDAGGTAHVFELCRLQNGVEYAPVLTGGAQTIEGTKTFYATQFSDVVIKSARVNDNIGGISFFKSDGARVSQIYAHTNGNIILNTLASGRIIALNQAAYNPANTDDIVTVGTLDNYTPMVRTTGNQVINGVKKQATTVTGTYMIDRVPTTHAMEVLKIENTTTGTYLFHLIVSGRFDLFMMRVSVVVNSDGDVSTVTTTAQGIYALSNTRQIVAGARCNNGTLRLSLRAKSGNTSISAMPMNCNMDGLTKTMDLTPYGETTSISNMTGYVEEP